MNAEGALDGIAQLQNPSHTSKDKLWKLMLDKIRRPEKYIPGVVLVKIVHEHSPFCIEREMVANDAKGQKAIRETICADEVSHSVIYKLKNDPDYSGYVLNIIYENKNAIELEYTICWTPKRKQIQTGSVSIADMIKRSVLHMKAVAEA